MPRLFRSLEPNGETGIKRPCPVARRHVVGTYSFGRHLRRERGDEGVYVAMLKQESEEPSLRSRGLIGAETAVLKLLVRRMTPLEMAQAQGASMATIRTHIARLHEKFDVRRTFDVVRIALAEGFGRL